MGNDNTLSPSRDEIIRMVAEHYYSSNILNNSHRGDIVEMMVLSALGGEWKLVGLGWHPWDLELRRDNKRYRIQVRQIAALQLWGKTKKYLLSFGWKKKAPDYFFRDHPGEEIEPEGCFCDIFIFGLHLEDDENKADQVDPSQWRFLVIPVKDLKRGLDSMILEKALKRWNPVEWNRLSETVENIIK